MAYPNHLSSIAVYPPGHWGHYFARVSTFLKMLRFLLTAKFRSPRWLVSRGRDQEAHRILTKYHGNGNPDDSVVQYEFQEIRETIELEIAAKKTSWKTLVSTRGNLWRSFILVWCGTLSPFWDTYSGLTSLPGVCKQWSGNGLISYYLGNMLKSAGITKEIQTTLITATSAIFSFACSVAFAFLPSRYGRRSLMLVSMALIWLVFVLITVCTGVYVEKGSKSASYATVAFIYLYNGVHNLGWTGAMMVYGEYIVIQTGPLYQALFPSAIN